MARPLERMSYSDWAKHFGTIPVLLVRATTLSGLSNRQSCAWWRTGAMTHGDQVLIDLDPFKHEPRLHELFLGASQSLIFLLANSAYSRGFAFTVAGQLVL